MRTYEAVRTCPGGVLGKFRIRAGLERVRVTVFSPGHIRYECLYCGNIWSIIQDLPDSAQDVLF